MESDQLGILCQAKSDYVDALFGAPSLCVFDMLRSDMRDASCACLLTRDAQPLPHLLNWFVQEVSHDAT
jgi:hypothetical protein